MAFGAYITPYMACFSRFQDEFTKNYRTKVMPFPFGDLKFTPFSTSQQNQVGLEMILTFFFRAWNVSVFFFGKLVYIWPFVGSV